MVVCVFTTGGFRKDCLLYPKNSILLTIPSRKRLMPTKIIRILPPHKLQEEIEDDPHRFRVVACGRRFGKTNLAMREAFNILVRGFAATNLKQRVWVVSPTFPLVREDWMIA